MAGVSGVAVEGRTIGWRFVCQKRPHHWMAGVSGSAVEDRTIGWRFVYQKVAPLDGGCECAIDGRAIGDGC
jgi:hypothetical protein